MGQRVVKGGVPPSVPRLPALPVEADPLAGPVALDPRWDWHEVQTFGDPLPTYVRGRCRHTELVPVTSCVDPDLVLARLCATCGGQLPPSRDPWV